MPQIEATEAQAMAAIKLVAEALPNTIRCIPMTSGDLWLNSINPFRIGPDGTIPRIAIKIRMQADPVIVPRPMPLGDAPVLAAAMLNHIRKHHIYKEDAADMKCIVGMVPSIVVNGNFTKFLIAVVLDPTL